MTVQKTFIKNIYIGNGSNKVFSFTFECPEEHPEFIHVYVRSNNELAETDNYTLNMEERKVIYPATGEALEAGGTLVIARELPLNQLLNLVNQGPFFAEDVEVTFDEVVMMIQQLNEKLGRTAAFDISVENFDPTLPIQAGYGFRVSDDGTHFEPIENSEIVLNQTKQVYNEAVAVKDEAVAANDKAQAAALRAGTSEGNAEDYSKLARAWAESPYYPDPTDLESKSSKSWAELARNDALEAARQAQYCTAMASQGVVFDFERTYNPGETVMTPEGATFRCIAESTGELPNLSNKWVAVTVITSDTFEEDENGDLMPLMYPKQSTQFDIDSNGDIMPGI